MASSGMDEIQRVLQALAAMQSNLDKAQKEQAHNFLEQFQKGPQAWTTTHTILSSQETSPETKLFAATTLKGKITYDLDQLPRQQLTPLRESLFVLLTKFSNGPKPIRTQLCVCLANLAIQMTEWKDVLQLVGSKLGNNALDCVLEFLRVLPEEVTEGRKINLTEEDLISRTKELLEGNSAQVLRLLVQYSQSSTSAVSNPRLWECTSSWLREIPSQDVVNSPLLGALFQALTIEASFEAAVDCLCTIYRDTQEVDECLEIIQILYPRVVSLRPRLALAAESEDNESFKGLTRVFAEAGEAWIVLIARLPAEFRGLVEAILECCVRDRERDAISLTFVFWSELKLLLTVDRYLPARNHLADIYAKLVDVMIKHLEFPIPEDGDETDLFDGDREQEEKFREFRHQMGDVLKDCCEVLTVPQCLTKAFDLIQKWISVYGAQATDTSVPHWQELEAPLFAMRAMGRMVSSEESTVLHQVIPLMVQIPNHEKLRFQSIMALARYTEWTAQHPEFLTPQLNFVIAGFDHPSKEVVRAAALAFRFFGTDCRKLLQDHVVQLHQLYESVIDNLPGGSQEEVTEGVAVVVSAQPPDKLYATMKLFCDPLIQRIKVRANEARGSAEKGPKFAVADAILLLTIFIQASPPYYSPSEEHQAVKYCQEILPVLSTVAESFSDCTPILERVCRCWRFMVISYRTAVMPLLPALAQQLATGFQNTRQGCFLWATDSVLREFAEGAEFVDPATSQNIYKFFEQQALAFLHIMNDLPPQDLPDVIEDFFRLLLDALVYYHNQLIPASIAEPIFQASIAALSLEQDHPLTVTLHYLRDFLSYGTDNPNSSSFTDNSQTSRPTPNPVIIQNRVKSLVSVHGEALVQQAVTGMLFRFPRDCLQDASGVLLELFDIMPQQVAIWVKNTIMMLPTGTVKQGDEERLMAAIGQKIQLGEMRKVRVLLQDFTNSYRRRNIAPREGLGRLEATRFRFNG